MRATEQHRAAPSLSSVAVWYDTCGCDGNSPFVMEIKTGKGTIPLVVLLAGQTVFILLYVVLVVFNVMGRNYDAAVMTAGFIGFAMGATSNAMANMQVVTKKYGPSPVAYFAIPMVGGMFIDFFNAVLIAANIGWWT